MDLHAWCGHGHVYTRFVSVWHQTVTSSISAKRFNLVTSNRSHLITHLEPKLWADSSCAAHTYGSTRDNGILSNTLAPARVSTCSLDVTPSKQKRRFSSQGHLKIETGQALFVFRATFLCLFRCFLNTQSMSAKSHNTGVANTILVTSQEKLGRVIYIIKAEL